MKASRDIIAEELRKRGEKAAERYLNSSKGETGGVSTSDQTLDDRIARLEEELGSLRREFEEEKKQRRLLEEDLRNFCNRLTDDGN